MRTAFLPRSEIAVSFALANEVGAVLHNASPTCAGWSLRDAQRVAEYFEQGGASYADFFANLTGPKSYELVGGVAPFADRGPRHLDGGTTWLVAKTRRPGLPKLVPATWDLIDLGASSVAVVRSGRTVFDWSHITACYEGPGSARTVPACFALRRLADFEQSTPQRFAQRSNPHSTMDEPFDEVQRASIAPYRLRYTVPLVAQPGEPTHVVQLADDRHLPTAWHIEAVGGAGVQRRNDREARVEPGPAEGRTITFSRDIPKGLEHHDRRWPPDVIETREDETELRALLANRQSCDVSRHAPP